MLPWILQESGATENVYWKSWAEINPADAAAHRIQNLDWIWIESPVGKISVQAVISAGTGPGVVNVPYGFGHTDMGRWAQGRGVNPLEILVPARDSLMGLVCRFGTKVKIYKA